MKWSKYQTAIFDDYRDGLGSTCISAVAGAGKSTTAVEMLNHAPKGLKGDTLLTSFGRDSIKELKSRELAWDIECRTMNSLGFHAIKNATGEFPKLNEQRAYRVLDDVLGTAPDDAVKKQSFNSFRARIKALIDFSKATLAEDINSILDLADHYEIDKIPPDWMRDRLADMFECPWEDAIAVITMKALEASKLDDGTVDYNDQLWLPVVLGYAVQPFSRIIVDEGQDTNPCQIELISRAAATDSRLFMFGQDEQAIYEWRAAGIGMQPFVDRFKAKRLPLSISYRCPKAVVAEAVKLVPGMLSAPDAIQGSVSTLVKDLLPTKLLIGDTVLSRTNAPLIRLFMKCLSNGTPVGMAGKDVGARLLKFVENSNSIDATQLLEYTDQWAKEEIERRKKRNPNAKTDAIDDHVECIRALAEDTNSIIVVTDRIKRMLLVPPAARVTLSTTHRAKGREWPRVFLLEDTFPVRASYWRQYASKKKGDPDKWSADMAARIQQESIEERNIMYVAITRAQQELIYVR